MEFQTSTNRYAENKEGMEIHICKSGTSDCCKTGKLNKPDSENFARGAFTVFDENDIGACKHFEAYFLSFNYKTITRVYLQHYGTDGWIGSFIRILFKNHSLYCHNHPDIILVDDGDLKALTCVFE